MTDTSKHVFDPERAAERVRQSLGRRRRQENLFRWMGVVALAIGLGFVGLLVVTIVAKGWSGFFQTQIALELEFELPQATTEAVDELNFRTILRDAIRAQFPDVTQRRDRRELSALVSNGAEFQLRDQLLNDPNAFASGDTIWLTADDDVDLYYKSRNDEGGPVAKLTEKQISWVEALDDRDMVRTALNWNFFRNGDSRDPEMAGVWGAAVGSFLVLTITLVLSFPLGVGTAIYLEEFAPKNKFTDLIEVNINNLAAVPSIIFGLLGLAVFINAFGMPRSAPLVGGLVLTLMTLPTIIIASRAALRAVPPSIREAAIGIGASPVQTVFHHVLPQALPGMLTGTIIGMAQALGETAPLLMIGMVAFIVDVPQGFTDPATTLPVQIFLWADSPERAFVEKTSAAIMVLLAVLAVMNITAVLLRRKLEKRW